MGYRKIPFGYRVNMGIEVIQPDEAELVRDIFNRYLNGESFKLLSERLECQPLSHDKDTSWNKNAVARMLEDTRYIGEKGYPAIIEAEIFHSVAERRKGQQSPIRKTEVEKILRQLCGRPATAKISAQVLATLNDIIQSPCIILSPPPPSQMEAVACRRKLEQILTQLPINEDNANALVRQSAVLLYQAIGPGEYETERLKRTFTAAQPLKQLNADFLRSTISTITVDGNTVTSIRLKNNQTIERSKAK
jgi:hypothetical protein